MMKFWEVIKELTDDPTKKFEAKLESKDWKACMRVDTGFSRYFKFEVFNGARLIEQSHGGGAFNGNVAFELDWELVRQPVTWQEAIQAWAEGKDIRLVMPEWEQVWKPTNSVGFNHCHINQGKWYVEPDCPDDALRNEKGQNACWIVEVEELREETEQYKAVATSEEVNESLCKLCANVGCYDNERNLMMLECTEYIPPKGEQ